MRTFLSKKNTEGIKHYLPDSCWGQTKRPWEEKPSVDAAGLIYPVSAGKNWHLSPKK